MRKIFLFVFSALLAMPYILHAEEIEIPLTEVVSMEPIPGDNPLDNPSQMGDNPTRPGNFRATIDFHFLSIVKLNPSIPSAHVIVVNAATGNVVVNRTMFDSLSEQITNSGVYLIHIQTFPNGAWEGQFIVQ